MKSNHPHKNPPVLDPETPDWRTNAVCASVDPELFFPDPHTPDTHPRVRSALDCCRTCPVIDRCLDYALAEDLRYGIWGGLTEIQRSRAAGRRRRYA